MIFLKKGGREENDFDVIYRPLIRFLPIIRSGRSYLQINVIMHSTLGFDPGRVISKTLNIRPSTQH